MHAAYRQDLRQATIVLTLTDATPETIARLAADPRTDNDTGTAEPGTADATPQDNSPPPAETRLQT
jgi:hypothetical protein